MKKLLFFAAMMLGLASCQTEPEGLGVDMGAQETNITVALPEVTRANSALSGLDNGVLADHDLRFILEIYQGNKCYRMESIGQETSAVFPVRLVPGHKYDLVVWADFVNKGAVELEDNDLYYETSTGLDEILVRNNVAMTEARDAYYGVYTLTEDKTPASIGTITLTRPFAKVRVVTTDLSDCIEELGLQPQTATVTYTTETYDKFDARNKNVWSVNNDDNEKFVEYDKSAYGEENLFVDYILVPQGTASVVKFDLNVTNVVARSFNTDIAVEANKLTTIKGNILTNGSDINVEIEDDFAAETIYLEGDVTLTENLVIDRPMVVRAGAKAVLNLNGHTITADLKQEGRHHYAIDNYGTLTLEGEGAINARGIENFGTMTINGNITITNVDTNGGSTIWNEGNLVINGGTFTTNAEAGEGSYGSALNTQEGGSAVINGGNFIANSQLTYAILNYGETVINNATVKGKHGAVASASGAAYKTTINGGSFELMENPGVSDHCVYYVSAIYGGTFSLGNNTDSGAKVFYESNFAPGYYALQYEAGKYTVQAFDADSRTLTINSKDEFLKLSILDAKWNEFFSNGQGTDVTDFYPQNGGKGKDFYYKWDWTIKLNVDIDFENATLNAPISVTKFGCFDGQNHTIKNVTIENATNAGLFVASFTKLQNIKLDNVHATTGYVGNSNAGILASVCNAGIDNITIANSSVVGGKYTGGVVGSGYTYVTNCTLTNCVVKGGYKCGGVIGYICAESSPGHNVTGNTLTNCTVAAAPQHADNKTEYILGKVVGNYNCNGTCADNVIDNMTTTATALIGKIEAGKVVNESNNL